MLTRRTLLGSAAAAATLPLVGPGASTGAQAATPKNIVAMAKQIDDIIGAFDPAESYEFTNNEVCGNLYRKLVVPDPHNVDRLLGDVAEKWEVSKDGSTFTFEIRKGITFESGKPLTAEDCAFSLQRVVKLNKTPGFILTQFGLTAENVEQNVRATGEYTLEMKIPIIQATSFVLYCLSATIGCVVEKATVMANQANNDLGNAWLKTHSAGAGSYKLVEWQASDHIILQGNPHAATKPKIPRVVIRHVADVSAQLLLLQKGDIDIARDLQSDQLKVIAGKPEFHTAEIAQLTSMYIGMNMGTPELKKVEARQAIKYAIDYEAIAKNITPKLWVVWQSFLPKGIPGAIADTPFKKDVAKAKDLLAKAGYPNGFSITLDHFAKSPYPEIAQAIQADLAAVGIKVQLLAGEQKQVISKTRARTTQLALTTWFPDYLDANSNAQAFCVSTDDSDDTKLKSVAWRYHFLDKEMSDAVEAAVKELDAKKRLEMYAKIQRDFMERAPFTFLLQNAEVSVMQKNVSGLALGVLPDYTRYAAITKA
ncbi:MAG TPA: ABC transporter substrate-binding protein [Stellaceae bacterium]|nr:ABC transporter substrate-binding protein [Stellaceae bacterium]